MAKLNKKKKLIIIISSVLVVAVAGTAIGVVAAEKNKGTEVQFQTITKQDVQSSINATADVEAGATREYKVGTIAKVNEVFVNVGDRVTEGQLLATFDTKELDTQINAMRQQYYNSSASYQSALAAANDAKTKIAAVDAQIAELESKLAQVKNEVSSALESATLPANGGNGETRLPQEFYDRIEKALQDLMANSGGTVPTMEQIQQAVQAAMNQAIADGVINGNEQIPNIDQIIQNMQDSAANSAMGGIGDEMQLASLKIQRQIQEITANASLTDTMKSLMNTTKKTIDTLVEQRDVLAAGWRADFNGVITQVNVAPGGDTSLLKAGIVLQGTDQMTAVITLGKYDLQKVTVGMSCKITVVNGSYDGEVAFIAPTAESGGGSSEILDSMSSAFGISGLGSLTGSSGGVRCEITIFNPDEKVVIGLDANVEITLDEKEDVVALPVECLKMDKEGKYVYLYDAQSKTVKKQPITVGVNSDLYYEVTEGLKAGDQVAASELSMLEDGQRVKVSTKTTKK